MTDTGAPSFDLPVGPFKTILADPAWSYENGGPRGGVDLQYPTMTLAEIQALPVASRAAKDAVLLLWATNPLMPEAFAVMGAWGFSYKTCLTWCKDTFGTGYWLRGKTEHLLIGVRGKPPLPTKAPASVAHLPNLGHSRKPRGFYPIYEALGGGPRLELFARDRREGWASWGNQLSRTIEATL